MNGDAVTVPTDMRSVGNGRPRRFDLAFNQNTTDTGSVVTLSSPHLSDGGSARQCVVYNSCGDRYCPTCAGAKRSDWIAPLAVDAAGFDPTSEHDESVRDDLPNELVESCPHCGGRLIPQAQREKPPWHEIFDSPHRPVWYRTLIGK